MPLSNPARSRHHPVKVVPISDLIPAPYNPRDISEEALAGLAASLERFGTVEPIVWNQRSRHVVGGHQRLQVLKARGDKDAQVVVVDLDDTEEKKLNLSLNNPHIAGEFTDDLQALLRELADSDEESFTDLLLDRLLDMSDQDLPPEIDAVPPPPKKAITKPGDIWAIGSHRLLCGDATKVDDLKRLVGAARIDCVWTDPPYGVSYIGKTKDALTIQGDDKEGLAPLLSAAFAAVSQILPDGAAIYVAHPAGAGSVVFGNCFLKEWRIHETLVWVKDTMVLGHSDYHYQHEPILFGYKAGGGRRGRGGEGWYGDNSQVSVFAVPKPAASEDHPTQKPVALVIAMIRNSSPNKGVVFDPFLGSGTTLVAAEQSGRRCFGTEIDPKYCDVIVRRWEDLTSQKAHVEEV